MLVKATQIEKKFIRRFHFCQDGGGAVSASGGGGGVYSKKLGHCQGSHA